MKVYILFCLFALVEINHCASQTKSKVDAFLWNKLIQEGKTDFFVIMKSNNEQPIINETWKKEQKAENIFKYLSQNAEESQSSLKRWLEDKKISFKSYYIINALYIEGDIKLVTELAERQDVLEIRYNSKITNKNAYSVQELDERTDPSWGILKINADKIWANGYFGEGVVIGGADTGYDWTHPLINAQYRGYRDNVDQAQHSYNWHDAIHELSPLSPSSPNPCGLSIKTPCDDNSHGTHTMGTMVGGEGDNLKLGVAPKAKWIACRNMERGNGSMATYVECFEFFLAPWDLEYKHPKPYLAPHVINNSWSCPETEGCNPTNFQTMVESVNQLKKSGIVVVVSAGNDGGSCGTINTVPAMIDNAFTVGAIRSSDDIAGFSSWGPVQVDGSNRIKPNIVAPGVGVRSSIPNNNYANYSGTSMAGPHVAGAVALLISAVPEISGRVELIESILERSARPMTHPAYNCSVYSGNEVPNPVYGFGILDINFAIQLAKKEIFNIVENPSIVQLFPNPVVKELNMDLQWFGGNTTIEIYAIDGKLVLTENMVLFNRQLVKLDVLALPSGVYSIRAKQGNQCGVKKFIKI